VGGDGIERERRCIVTTMTEARMEEWVRRWHRGEGRGKPLHEWLGLTWAEYSDWAACKLTDTAAVALAISRKASATTPKE
jgi:hypothetical protein